MLQTFVKLGVGQNARIEHPLEKPHDAQNRKEQQNRDQNGAEREIDPAHLYPDKRLFGGIKQIRPRNIGKDQHRQRHGHREHNDINRHTQPEIKRAMHRITGPVIIGCRRLHQIGMHKGARIAAQQPVTGDKRKPGHQVFKDEPCERHIAQKRQYRQQDRHDPQSAARPSFDLGP